MSTLVLALLAGAVVGLALGALGGGGSVLAVPALIYLLGFTPAAATTASLVIVTATSLTALFAHAREGRVRWRTGGLFALAGLVPAAVGGALAGELPPALLTGAFALIAAAVAVTMLRPARPAAGPDSVSALGSVPSSGPLPGAGGPHPGDERNAEALRDTGAVRDGETARNDGEAGEAGQGEHSGPDGHLGPHGDSGPHGRSGQDDDRTAAGRSPGRDGSGDADGNGAGTETGTGNASGGIRAAAGAGAGLGAVTGFLGVGGGFLAVPALIRSLGLRMHTAIGTSLLVIAVNSLAALTTRAGTADSLDWAVVAPFAAAAILGAWDGKRLSGKVRGDTLRRIFAWALLGVAVLMLTDALR
jgi:uncharacterized protein